MTDDRYIEDDPQEPTPEHDAFCDHTDELERADAPETRKD